MSHDSATGDAKTGAPHCATESSSHAAASTAVPASQTLPAFSPLLLFRLSRFPAIVLSLWNALDAAAAVSWRHHRRSLGGIGSEWWTALRRILMSLPVRLYQLQQLEEYLQQTMRVTVTQNTPQDVH